MLKRIYTLILFSLFAASCNKGEPMHESLESETPISFYSGELTASWDTRGYATDKMSDVESIMVYAFLSDPDQATSCYIENKAATRVGETWSFTPEYYYPLNHSLDFLAYTPIAAPSASKNSNNGLSHTLDFKNKAITIRYNMPTDGRNQPDLMLATPVAGLNQDKQLEMLSFSHALCQLSLSARVSSATQQNRYVITRFTMHNITIGAELTYSIEGGVGQWSETSNGDYITSAMLPDPSIQGEEQVKLTDSFKSIMSNGHTLFMIPQAIEQSDKQNSPTIQITIYDTQEDSELTYRTDRLDLPSLDGKGWKAGQHINLQFTFDVDSEDVVIPMSLDAKLLDWIEQDIDEEVDTNIYSYLDKSSVDEGEGELTLYTNGEVKSIWADGAVIASAVLGAADSSGNYPITFTTAESGVGSISVVIENSRETTITKTFKITVK